MDFQSKAAHKLANVFPLVLTGFNTKFLPTAGIFLTSRRRYRLYAVFGGNLVLGECWLALCLESHLVFSPLLRSV